jgi:UDP-N-acetylglucosamine--N-acetylmuramyl-(pentapeptide) pyrophosphoryl-undecaprenol N-acetylglucosamine transferase
LNVVFAGGGTGGHLYPAIAIADALRESDGANVTFVGVADRLEATIVPAAGYRLETVPSRPLGSSLARVVAVNAAGVARSWGLLSGLRPDLVIATGGYVCFPVVTAARMRRSAGATRAPIALLELNVKPGLTNRTLAPLVDEIWGAFPVDDPRLARKYVQTGVPVRAAIRTLPPRAQAVARFGLDPARKTLLAMGGSQGARSINAAVRSLLEQGGLSPQWQVLLVTGASEWERWGRGAPAGAVALPYIDDVAAAYAAADLVLARAGASTLAELTAAGKPAILVPYPFAAGDHQTENACRFAESGAAVVVSDADLAASLASVVRDVAVPSQFERLDAAAKRMRGADALAAVLARVHRLTQRKTER